MTITAPPTDIELRKLAATSLSVILNQQHPGGAYAASPVFSAYLGYSWFRDGSFIADAASAAGAADSATAFHDWCARIVTDRADRIREIVARADSDDPAPDDVMLATRFTFDGAEGSDDWWDFQLDGYGTWLWALAAHTDRHGADAQRWSEAVELCTLYLASSWRRPCFDWWEEYRDEVHVSTLGCIAAGLRAARGLGVLSETASDAASRASEEIEHILESTALHNGHLSKWIGSASVDGSLAALVGVLGVTRAQSVVGRATIDAIERDLVIDDGTFRYRGDTFFGGGQWPLLSCFLGQAHLAAGDPGRARELLAWAASTADSDGMLPEQVADHLNDPDFVDTWIQRWGPVARPLVWSHAMMLRLSLDLGVVTPEDLAQVHA